MVQEGIVLGHKISSKRIEVDKVKIEAIEKLPPPISVKVVKSFLGHTSFYRRFIKDFFKIARPLTNLFQKDIPFDFSEECLEVFKVLKEKFHHNQNLFICLKYPKNHFQIVFTHAL